MNAKKAKIVYPFSWTVTGDYCDESLVDYVSTMDSYLLTKCAAKLDPTYLVAPAPSTNN